MRPEMTLLERYLHAVKKRLPRNQRDDIVAELRDILLSQIEAEEAAHRRRLSDDEVAVILRRFGRPMTVAARYGASNYLIGPALYPAYLASLKVLAWVWGPIAALSVFLSVVTADDPFRQAAWKLLLVTVIGLANFAIITLIFARIERAAALLRHECRPLGPALATVSGAARADTAVAGNGIDSPDDFLSTALARRLAD